MDSLLSERFELMSAPEQDPKTNGLARAYSLILNACRSDACSKEESGHDPERTMKSPDCRLHEVDDKKSIGQSRIIEGNKIDRLI